MIRHTLSFRFADGVDEATRESVLAELRTFPDRYPAMCGFVLGENISTRDQTFTHTMAVDFDSQDDLLAYLGSESHESFVRTRWRPVIAQQAITSFEFAERPSLAAGRTPPVSTRPHGPYGMEYARIEVPDMQATIDFLEYHVGLQLEQRTDEYAYLRADIEHHAIELIHAPERTDGWTTAIGYSVESEEVLEQLHKSVLDAGLEVLELQERQKALCDNGFAVKDPDGLIVELFTEFQEYAEPPHIEIRPLDLVHPFIATAKFEETVDFYQNVLRFRPSDHVVGSTTFFRGEDRYHHSLAIQNNKEHFTAHLCFAMKSLDHVMRMRARALYKGAPIASDIVNHSASTSIAFYLHDPRFGPRYELCDRHRVFTPEEHETHRPRRMPADPRNIDVWRPASDDWGRF
ncbi:putative Metapyrocatechase [Streptomyces afghaniensis 772]|uniref:Putative Metapyrocatechase n=1 Tax=Streptomyces afghaniensis 772 TaxID=1283301 RepID=S4N9H3_9ACTN|nr:MULTISPECIES: VOC family protein [Streptomyces]EPJ34374.1 putative Metapyrocatechase [Streptomyces afghaniensis 772]UOB14834.1 VOC family protein [Streptomyces sp. HP-A2021]